MDSFLQVQEYSEEDSREKEGCAYAEPLAIEGTPFGDPVKHAEQQYEGGEDFKEEVSIEQIIYDEQVAKSSQCLQHEQSIPLDWAHYVLSLF